jgi:hypothetical protein
MPPELECNNHAEIQSLQRAQGSEIQRLQGNSAAPTSDHESRIHKLVEEFGSLHKILRVAGDSHIEAIARSNQLANSLDESNKDKDKQIKALRERLERFNNQSETSTKKKR